MNKPVTGKYPPKTCYICSGRGIIPVVELDGDEQSTSYATCVRCHGNRVLTDGITLDSLGGLDGTIRARSEPPCICDYTRDGPEGHPQCRGR